MKKPILFFGILLMSLAGMAQAVDSARIQQTGLDGTTAISTDDAEQLNNAIDKLFDDDLDMGWEGDEFNVVTLGLVFRGLDMPQGATIDSAFVVFYAHEDEGDLAKVTIHAEAADSAVTYNETDLITARPQTTAEVKWDVADAWTIWTPHRTPDLKTLVQEVVSRPGWKPGNSINLIFSGEDQGASTQDNARDVEAFENIADPDDGGDGLNHPERIPQLLVYYSGRTAADDRLTVTGLTVSPNPITAHTFEVKVAPFQQENITLTLLDLSGKAVAAWTRTRVQEEVISLDLDVAPGFYTLQVASETRRGFTHVVVQ
ncbi:MAG: T9SS type A sorting domain-containing protein [Bacteroidia bacterium]|nr:T9SS type A sorting domain-containing protein [Bacteroidia bacterium]